jgi:hypothetical protein
MLKPLGFAFFWGVVFLPHGARLALWVVLLKRMLKHIDWAVFDTRNLSLPRNHHLNIRYVSS